MNVIDGSHNLPPLLQFTIHSIPFDSFPLIFSFSLNSTPWNPYSKASTRKNLYHFLITTKPQMIHHHQYPECVEGCLFLISNSQRSLTRPHGRYAVPNPYLQLVIQHLRPLETGGIVAGHGFFLENLCLHKIWRWIRKKLRFLVVITKGAGDMLFISLDPRSGSLLDRINRDSLKPFVLFKPDKFHVSLVGNSFHTYSICYIIDF